MLINKDRSLLILVDIQEKLAPHVLNSEAMINRCAWMQRLAHRLEVPMIVSEQYPQGLGSTVPELSLAAAESNRIAKVDFSCMADQGFQQVMHQFNREQLILIGIETHVCVLQTALQALESGKEVFVVVDAVSSRHEVDMKYGLKRMKQAGVELVTAEMVFFEWLRRAGDPKFKLLSKEFLQ